jgi:elongator complex protein 3
MLVEEKANNYFVTQALKLKEITPRALFKLRYQTAKKFQVPCPSNIALLKTYQKLVKSKKVRSNSVLEEQLKTRPIRNLSGVAVIAVLTKPYPCPGNCLFCPTQKDVPKSYLKNEPAVMRAILHQYDPHKQVRRRLEALQMNGHSTDKVELIVIGGTFSYLPHNYQVHFIKRCFDALNQRTANDLAQAKEWNETAQNRCVGLTLETRPDYINLAEIKRMRQLGATRVEIGVQTIDDSILRRNRRGHSVQKTIVATRLLKDAGFKVCYHLMPNLLGSNPQKDFTMFQKIFTDHHFQPDQVKIYPCVVTKESDLYQLWQTGKYHPYSEKELTDLLVKIKKVTPPYVRIIRLIRDIPTTEIFAGNRISNLRQILKEKGIQCQCIRCREAREKAINPRDLVYSQIEYQTLGGKELFLQFTFKNKQTLFAFLRLRLPTWKRGKFLTSLKEAALLRELHTYGQLVPLKESGCNYAQHRGLGKELIQKAEVIAREAGYKKIAVIAGVGVREYYWKLGYQELNRDEYLAKDL